MIFHPHENLSILQAVAASSSNLPSLLSFLQRRRFEAAKVCMKVLFCNYEELFIVFGIYEIRTCGYSARIINL